MFKAAEKRLRGSVVGALALACSATGMLALTYTARARANEVTVFSCHDPGGEAVGHDGWVNQRTADTNMIAVDSCGGAGAGYLSLELAANFGGYANGARTEWVFQAPAWASIASYTLDLAGSYAVPSTGGGSGQAFVNASDESDPNYDYRNLGAAGQGAWVLSRTPPAPVGTLTLNASCDGASGPCPANTRISALYLTTSRILLRDETSPTVGSLFGNLLPGSTVRGTGEADFTAADSGPGVYSAQLSIDGSPQAPVLLDSNGGWCRDLGQSGDGTRSFAHPDPCMQSLSGSVSLDTSALTDGEHSIRLTVDDASGNAMTAFSGTISTHNAPVNSSAPAIVVGAGLGAGSTLSASTGAWSAPTGAGPISYGYQWQDCDMRDGACEPIAGAQSSSYTTTPADAGHTLRVVVNASDRDGAASAASATSGTVSVPPAPGAAMLAAVPGTPNGNGASEAASMHVTQVGSLTRAYVHSALTVMGSLTVQGHPIAGAGLDLLESAGAGMRVIGHAGTAADGTFAARVPAGASRTVLVAYRAYSSDPGYAASAAVRESVLAGVRLSVTPRHTSSNGTILLSGRVLGSVPRAGVIVELLVRYRGAWEPFRTPRSDAHGRFRVAYQFQGATGRFPFRAEVPGGQMSFPYADGRSATVTVRSG
jgi:hypothetical protein